MIAGRKLLLADDSVAIQKVVDLTFSDEGMKVTVVGDGQQALDKLAETAPDVVLADVFMPGVDGYKLCESIKQDARFAGIPVMLLVGSFEPYDEAEARQVGADDVMTKPFQSIRQLVGRVGSLLGGKPDGEGQNSHEYSMLGISGQDYEPQASATGSENGAGVITTKTSEADIAAQTADTKQLPHVEPEPADEFSDALLDLGDVRGGARVSASADPFLDIDFGEEDVAVAKPAPPAKDLSGVVERSPVVTANQEWSIVAERVAVESTQAESKAAEVEAAPAPSPTNPADLSPEAIDAIARRVVEHLSDKVVREIAWEVVPELAELLIKQKLEEQK